MIKMLNINYRKKLFIRFLKENNCYDKYINYFNKTNFSLVCCSNNIQSIDDLINFIINKYITNNYRYSEIDLGISWSQTSEGFKFWSDINCIWRDIIWKKI